MNRRNEQSALEYFPEAERKGSDPGGIYHGKDSGEIERDVEFTILQMRETLDAIEYKLSPRQVKKKMQGFFSTPSGKLLVGFGVLTLIRRKPVLSTLVGLGGAMYALNRMRIQYAVCEPEIMEALEAERDRRAPRSLPMRREVGFEER